LLAARDHSVPVR
jgi:hypothetical protein